MKTKARTPVENFKPKKPKEEEPTWPIPAGPRTTQLSLKEETGMFYKTPFESSKIHKNILFLQDWVHCPKQRLQISSRVPGKGARSSRATNA